MSENLFDILDDCLSRLDSGEDIESCLGHYPRHASELRPLLLAATDAASLAPADTVPPAVMKRGKAKLLNVAAEMREQKAVRRSPFAAWRFPLRRAVAVLAVLVAFVLLGGTGLVRASSGSVPGDQLYPVKRTWEQVLLQVVTNPQVRANLEIEFENERLDELKHLTGQGREAEVEFSGVVTGIFPDQIIIAGMPVYISPATSIEGNIQLNAMVKVEGQTRVDGSVLASEIKVIGAGDGEDSEESESSGNGSQFEVEDKTQTPNVKGSETPEPPENETDAETQGSTETPKLSNFEIEGEIKSFSGNRIVVDNKVILINAGTEIRGSLASGATVKVKGLVYPDGSLVATRIEVESSSGDSTAAPVETKESTPSPENKPTDDNSGSSTQQPTETPKPDDD